MKFQSRIIKNTLAAAFALASVGMLALVVSGCGGGGSGGATSSAPPPHVFTGTETVLYSFASGVDGAEPMDTLLQASDGNFYGTASGGGGVFGLGYGVVFKITPAGVETVLHTFTGGTLDGMSPQGSLMQANDGNLYGTTYYGGANGQGTVFKITLAGAESIVYSFQGGTDGYNPSSNLIQGNDGNLYGTTYNGGANNRGTVFKLSLGGLESVIHSFGSGSDGAGPFAGLVQANDGNLYGTTSFGGAFLNGTVFKISLPSGSETVLHSFAGATTDGSWPQASLIQAGDGNLYGTTVTGGANNAGTVFKITTAGVETVVYSFAVGADANGPQYGHLVQTSDGSFYGVGSGGGASGNGAVFRIDATGAESVLYSFAGGTTDGTYPWGGLIQASDGNLYGTTWQGGANNYGIVYKIQ